MHNLNSSVYSSRHTENQEKNAAQLVFQPKIETENVLLESFLLLFIIAKLVNLIIKGR